MKNLIYLLIVFLFSCQNTSETQKVDSVAVNSDDMKASQEPDDFEKAFLKRNRSDFFIYPSRTEIFDSIWNESENGSVLIRYLNDSSRNHFIQFIITEILFEKKPSFIDQTNSIKIAALYSEALKNNYTEFSNPWGLLLMKGDAGVTGRHFLSLGKSAEPEWIKLLSDTTSVHNFWGSKEATTGNGCKYRVKDFAAYYLAWSKNIDMRHSWEPAERDIEIEKLKSQIRSN